MTPYNHTDRTIHGFQATHQPAIWMGESGNVQLVPGVGDVKSKFEDRGLTFDKSDESPGVALYTVTMDDGVGGTVGVEMSASKLF